MSPHFFIRDEFKSYYLFSNWLQASSVHMIWKSIRYNISLNERNLKTHFWHLHGNFCVNVQIMYKQSHCLTIHSWLFVLYVFPSNETKVSVFGFLTHPSTHSQRWAIPFDSICHLFTLLIHTRFYSIIYWINKKT